MKFLFLFAVFLIPFDNLAFAPSKGWAAVSPYLFFLYATLSAAKHKEIHKTVLQVAMVISFLLLYSLFRFFEFLPDLGLFFRNAFSLIVGFSFLVSMYYFVIHEKQKVDIQKIDLFAKAIFYGYVLSLIYGMTYILAYKLGLEPVTNLFKALQARSYIHRFQFSFTEPSFTSIHLYGILFFTIVISILFRASAPLTNRLTILFFMYVLVAFFLIDSARFKLDTVFFFLLIFFVYALRKNFLITLLITFFTVLTISMYGPLALEYLFENRFNFNIGILGLINSDSSLAARVFRVIALYNGTIDNLSILFLGTGISNAWHAFLAGYDYSIHFYTNSYTEEVDDLTNSNASNYFNMPIRLLVEYGMIISFVLLVSLFSKRFWWLFLLLVYIYMQFDSYAFYLIWYYIFIIKFYEQNTINVHSTNNEKQDKPKIFLLTRVFYRLLR